MKSSTEVLFAGVFLPGTTPLHDLVTRRDGTPIAQVRVRELAARHHLELIELFHAGREADLIQRCVEHGTRGDAGAVTWAPVTAEWIDALADDSHTRLVAICEELNFSRAIRTAERQIARGQMLQPLMKTMTAQLMEPMKRELASWTSSLTSQISAAAAAKPH